MSDHSHTPPPFDPPLSPEELEAAAAANEADAAATREQALAELDSLKTQVAALTEQTLRAHAEAQNARRRADDEVAKIRKFAIEGFAESLLPVVDSLQAAIAMPDAKVEAVLEGVHATLRQLTQVLERNKVLEIAPQPGSRFDPHFQQAISMVPADQEPNTVVTLLQKGYQIADRVLRPALVTVAAPR